MLLINLFCFLSILSILFNCCHFNVEFDLKNNDQFIFNRYFYYFVINVFFYYYIILNFRTILYKLNRNYPTSLEFVEFWMIFQYRCIPWMYFMIDALCRPGSTLKYFCYLLFSTTKRVDASLEGCWGGVYSSEIYSDFSAVYLIFFQQ